MHEINYNLGGGPGGSLWSLPTCFTFFLTFCAIAIVTSFNVWNFEKDFFKFSFFQLDIFRCFDFFYDKCQIKVNTNKVQKPRRFAKIYNTVPS